MSEFYSHDFRNILLKKPWQMRRWPRSAFASATGSADLPRPGPKTSADPVFELQFPDRDLVGMHVELLRKLRKRSIAFDGCKGHF